MIYLSKKTAAEMVGHSREDAPREVCGILAGAVVPETRSGQPVRDTAGKKREVIKVYRMTNTDRSASSFFMDPKEQLRVMKDMRSSGLEMVGVYHSHPETAAYPSAHDVSMAFYPDISYLIISLEGPCAPVIRSFVIKNGVIKEEEVVTEQEI